MSTRDLLLRFGYGLMDRGLLPDAVIRSGIRRLCRRRLTQERRREATGDRFFDRMRSGPVAPVPEKANEQHYEEPPAFFDLVLGPRRKYSACWWPHGVSTLAAAEDAALTASCARAELEDGQDILELGCGWGSLTLWMAEKYPNASITAVSNSAPQREFIEAQCRQRGFTNVAVITADMNEFDPEGHFDRIVSIEMFEHMRNYEELLRRVASWLRPDGKLFVHIFCHRTHAYPFESAGAADWMAEHFFTGGVMPNFDIFRSFPDHMTLDESWAWEGVHYQKTAEAWLRNLDANRAEAEAILAETHGPAHARVMVQRWRVFFMACAECFGYDDGREWLVGHYRLAPAAAAARPATSPALASV